MVHPLCWFWFPPVPLLPRALPPPAPAHRHHPTNDPVCPHVQPNFQLPGCHGTLTAPVLAFSPRPHFHAHSHCTYPASGTSPHSNQFTRRSSPLSGPLAVLGHTLRQFLFPRPPPLPCPLLLPVPIYQHLPAPEPIHPHTHPCFQSPGCHGAPTALVLAFPPPCFYALSRGRYLPIGTSPH
jgi:hypothetical protein